MTNTETAGRNGKVRLPFDPKAFVLKVSAGRTISEYGAEEVVYRQGDSADAVFYLQSGIAKVTVRSGRSRDAVVAVLGPGDFLGEGCLGGHTLRLATVTTLADCRITRIPKAEIARLIRSEPAFGELFIAHLLARNSRVEADLISQLCNSSEKRLARTLLLLANIGEEGEPEAVLLKISQETLADIVGTTRSRVSHFMNKFRKLGLIDYNGHIEVHRSLLEVILQDTPDIRSGS